MAQKLYELAVQLQGKVDGSLEGAMKSTQGHIKDLEEKVKAYQERQKDVGPLEAAYARNSASAQALGKTILDLKGNLSDVSKYEAQRKATAEVGRAWLDAKHELKSLTAAYAQDKTDTNRKAMQAAAKEAKSLEKAYGKNKTSLQKMEQGLTKAGVNTRNLSGEQKRLSEELSQATKKQDDYTAAAKRAADTKAHWEALTAKVSKYSRAAWQAAKWTAGIATALGYGAFRITKSTAEAGDQAAKLGKKVRMSAEDVQKLQSVANLSGVRDFSAALTTMTKNTDMAVKKRGKAVQAFKELGIRPEDFSKAGSSKGLLVLAARLQKINDVSKQTRILQGIFGDQWGEMAEMLRQGPEAIAKGMKEAEERGILSNASAEKSEEFLDNITRMQEAVNGLKITIGDELRPVVNDIVLAVTEWIKQNKALISEKLRRWMEVIRETLPKIRDNIFWLAEKLGKLIDLFSAGVDSIGGFRNALTLLTAFLAGKKLLDGVSVASKAFSGLISLYDKVKGIDASALPGVPGAGQAAEGAATAAGGATAVGGAAAAAPAMSMSAAWAGGIATASAMALYNYLGNQRYEFSERQGLGEKKEISPEEWNARLEAHRKQRAEENERRRQEKIMAGQPKVEIRDPLVNVGPITLPDLGVTTDDVSVNSKAQFIAQNARGGLVSSPTVSRLAERGAEMVVPLNEADRSLGKYRLLEAAHKLRIPIPDRQNGIAKLPQIPDAATININQAQQNAPAPARSTGMPKLTFAPVFHITGEDGRKTAEAIEARIRNAFAEMMQNYKDEWERVAYGTT